MGNKKFKIKLNAHNIISESIYNSILAGYKEAFKHSENPPPKYPDEETIAEHIHNYIMIDLDNLVNWNKGDD